MRGRKSKVIVTTAFEFRMLGFAATFNRKESPPRAGAYEVPVETLDQLVETLDDVPTLIKCDAEGTAPREKRLWGLLYLSPQMRVPHVPF
jgi:hypothetical protein